MVRLSFRGLLLRKDGLDARLRLLLLLTLSSATVALGTTSSVHFEICLLRGPDNNGKTVDCLISDMIFCCWAESLILRT